MKVLIRSNLDSCLALKKKKKDKLYVNEPLLILKGTKIKLNFEFLLNL